MLTLEQVRKTYARIREEWRRDLERRDYAAVWSDIDTFADVALHVNDRLRDDEIEQLLRRTAAEALRGEEAEGGDRLPEALNPRRVVFYDQMGSTVCLVQQYLRGLLAAGYEVLYVFESCYLHLSPRLRSEVEERCAATCIHDGYAPRRAVEVARAIRQAIVDFGASKIVIHSPAHGAAGAAVLYSLPGLERYRIVPGDHHFYVGIDCIDRFFEFRDFGVKTAVEERKIPIEKIVKLPFYPLIDTSDAFCGFPREAEGKVKIFAGGNEYKFHGSEWFFDTCEWLLNRFPEAVILLSGAKSRRMKRFVARRGLKGRCLLLGYRTDFAECVRRSDLLLDSYPFPGGLVCQTAARFGIPILSYTTPDDALNRSVRGLLGAEEVDSPVSFEDDEAFRSYVGRMIADGAFRREEGRRMQRLLQTGERFNRELAAVLAGEERPLPRLSERSCNMEKRTRWYIGLQNDFSPTILPVLIRRYGVYLTKFLFLAPLTFRYFKKVVRLLFRHWRGKD